MNNYGKNPEYAILKNANKQNCANGRHFEIEMVKLLTRAFKDDRNFRIESQINNNEDTHKGTDIIVKRLNPETKKYETYCRLDPTIHFDGKLEKHTKFETDSKIVAASWLHENYKFGMRYGVTHYNKNTHKVEYTNYEMPVVIIGCNINDNVYFKYKDVINEQILNHAKEMVEMARKFYEQHKDYDYQNLHQNEIQKSIEKLTEIRNHKIEARRAEQEKQQNRKLQNVKPKKSNTITFVDAKNHTIKTIDKNSKKLPSNLKKPKNAQETVKYVTNQANNINLKKGVDENVKNS